MSVTFSARYKEIIRNRNRDPVGPEEIRCAACGTVIPEDDYPHDCGDPSPDVQPPAIRYDENPPL